MDTSSSDRAHSARHGSPFLNPQQAAAWLQISLRHLMHLRVAGDGPRFRRHCRRVQYHIDDLEAWSRETAARRIRP
jgi:hypothetical protein